MNGAQIDPTSSASSGGETLGEERLFDLLGNERRRSCLQRLALAEGPITVQDLANQVAVHVSDDESSPDDIRDSVYISLCQNHLPKLDDAAVVDYDAAEKVVGPGPSFRAVERHLLADPGGKSDPDSMRYALVASAATVFVLTAATVGVPVARTYGVPALIVAHGAAVVALGRRLP